MKSLEAVRLTKGITRKQMAERIGINIRTLARWELGESQPSAVLLKKYRDAIAREYDVEPLSILERIPEEYQRVRR